MYKPIIKTQLPHPQDIALIKELTRYSPPSMQQQIPIVWDRAENYFVYDRHGNRFIDFTSTICVTNSGHGNKDVCNALRKQINKPLLHSYTFPTEIRLAYLKKLTQFTGFDKAFLLSSGTEATEAACKIMRKHTGKKYILSFGGAMHGKTALAEALKGIHTDDDMNVICMPYPINGGYTNWSDYIEHLTDRDIAGIIIESYRGWDAQFFSSKFIHDIAVWAKKNKVLVCFDEIQSGWGRTGKLFAYEYYGIKPDLVCCGKGISGGVPLSAVLGRKPLLDIPSDFSSTNSANPLVCGAGLANLTYFETHDLVKEAEQKGNIITKILYSCGWNTKKIQYIQGRGLVWAIVTYTEKQATEIVMECFKKGLLTIWTHRNSIKIAPPLTINIKALEEGFKILQEVIK